MRKGTLKMRIKWRAFFVFLTISVFVGIATLLGALPERVNSWSSAYNDGEGYIDVEYKEGELFRITDESGNGIDIIQIDVDSRYQYYLLEDKGDYVITCPLVETREFRFVHLVRTKIDNPISISAEDFCARVVK